MLSIILMCGAILLLIGSWGVFIHLYLIVVTVDGESMVPTLEPGDRILILRTRSSTCVQKGRVVLIDPMHTVNSPFKLSRQAKLQPVIKRVVALEGEKLKIPFTSQIMQEGDGSEQRVWNIPQGHIFVRGDNEEHSIDSRLWGPLPLYVVRGIMLMKLSRKTSGRLDRLVQSQWFKQGVPVGEMAPLFTAETTSGEKVRLENYCDRNLLLLFVASTNLSCSYMPFLNELASRASAIGISVIYISMSSAPRTQEFIEAWNITQPVLVAPSNENRLFDNYSVPGVPFYCFIDAQGRVQATGRTSPHIYSQIKECGYHFDSEERGEDLSPCKH